MKMIQEKEIKKIIKWGKTIYDQGFVAGASGNLSVKQENGAILITSSGSFLGDLKTSDVLLLDKKRRILGSKKRPTSEKKVHFDIHESFKEKIILHVHSEFTTLYFAKFKKLLPISFETGVYLGDFEVIKQTGPNVIDTEPVVKALKHSRIVVLKNHGVIAIGDTFRDAISVIEVLEKEAKLNVFLKCMKR